MADQKVKELTEKLEKGVKELFESDRYKEYLSAMGKFHNYSFNNAMLIKLQRPEVTRVASYTSWKNDFDRQVRKGAKGIKIIQPCPYRKTFYVDKKDENGNTITGSDGKIQKEKVQKIIRGFKVGHVFAYEDTAGAPLPEIVTTLGDDVNEYSNFKECLEAASPVPVVFEDIGGTGNGYFSLTEKSIHIKSGLPELQTVKTLVHEMSHAILHDKDEGTDPETTINEKEVEAESVAYVVCSYYGLDTSDYSFGYIAGWSRDKDNRELSRCMDAIQRTARYIIDKVDSMFLERRLLAEDELAYKFPDGYLHIKDTGNTFTFMSADRKAGHAESHESPKMGRSILQAAEDEARARGRDLGQGVLYNPKSLIEKIQQQGVQGEEEELAVSPLSAGKVYLHR